MKPNRKEKKAVRSRNYVKAQYYKIARLKRKLLVEEMNLMNMTSVIDMTIFPRNYVTAQYYRVARLKRELLVEEGDLMSMTVRPRCSSYLWTAYHTN